MAVVMACAMVACGDDDDPNDPGNSVPDPEGTVELRMRNGNNGETSLRAGDFDIWIDAGNNLVGASFAKMGKMKGLGNITKIPTSGWAEKVSVDPGCGYVARSHSGTYMRIYVIDYVTSAEQTNGIIGFTVKYQQPFVPENTLRLEGTVDLDAEAGSSQAIKITRYVPFDIPEVWEDWLKITKGKDEIRFTALTDAPANANAQGRVARIRIVDETGYPSTIEVRQMSGNLQLEDYGNVLELGAAANSSKSIKIEHYLAYEVYYDTSCFKVTQSKTEIVITTLLENTGISSMNIGTIQVVDAAGYYRYIKVVQKPGKQ